MVKDIIERLEALAMDKNGQEAELIDEAIEEILRLRRAVEEGQADDDDAA